jgi:ribosomal protein S12 methylthiotransferase accessory factor
MLKRPSWNESYHVEVLDEAQVLLLDEREAKLLEGRVFPLLSPLLDGRRSVDEIYATLGGSVFPAEVEYALEIGRLRGLIVEGSDEAPPFGAAPFWHVLGLSWQQVRDCLAHARVSVRSVGSVAAAEAAEPLSRLGAACAPGGDLSLVLADDYLHPELEALNREALESGRPWLLARPVGNTAMIGPLFVPGHTGCWECLAQRLRSNRLVEGFLERRGAVPVRPPLSAVPTLVRAALELAATEVVRAMVLRERSPLAGRVLTWDAVALESARHVLVRRPQCPACGTPRDPARAPEPVVLRSCPRRAANEGGHRREPAEVTHRRLSHHVSPITGVVRSLQSFGEEDESGLAHSYAAGHNFALMSADVRFLLATLRGRSGGKGTSDVQARVSAIAEAIERYAGVWRGEEPSVLASYAELGAAAVQPYALMGYSETQYRERDVRNTPDGSRFHYIPEPFDETRPLHWTPVWSLTGGGFRWVPATYCFYGHPDQQRWLFSTCDSNGNAAGSTLEEAVLQGFLELVERDAVAMWWYNRVQRPGVDLGSFREPYLDALQEHYRRLGRELWVVDLTADLGIPVFGGISRRVGASAEDIVVGFGAHLDPRLALLRAVTEVNQFLPAVQAQDARGNTIYRFPEREAIDWWRTATIAENPYLLPHPELAPTTAATYADRSTGDLRDDVELCVEAARARGLEVLVMDQSQPDVDMAVVKVLVPGMRHFWKRFGPGRLYDVPVELGWLASPTPEAELNPRGIFF